MAILNLGIVAHVDAGKTSLTERILFETGVIAAAGRVDHGTTQTDTLALERQRGITIQSAVASFALDELTVNLIDTPGHPDFIAEVDRALQVLDAVVVVISAVEGVQPQTHRLVQAITAAGLPFIVFVNKIDRVGARGLALVPEIERQLGHALVAITAPSGEGTREATVAPRSFDDPAVAEAVLEQLADVDDAIVARFVTHDGRLTGEELHAALRRVVVAGRLAPVCFGSAMTGAGVEHLLAWLPCLAPRRRPSPDGPLSALVFKVQRSPAGEKIALARLFGGTLAVRDRVVTRRPAATGEWTIGEARVTALERYAGGVPSTVGSVTAPDIARLHGVREIAVGDVLGEVPAKRRPLRFPQPTLESVIRPREAADTTRLYAALQRLEEQDPLISLRRGTREPIVSIRLYGEVQKEVIEATLDDEFGVAVAFDPSQVICIERVTGIGSAREAIGQPGNPFWATVGFRIEAGAPESGIKYHRELGALPLAFYRAIEETVFATLEEGLHGWPVHDCRITLTEVGMVPTSAAGDFRKLTPLVLMNALQEAGTKVCEPIARFTLELLGGELGEVYAALVAAGAALDVTERRGERTWLAGTLPTAAVDGFERRLPDVTGGTGVFRAEAAGYRPVAGGPPSRRRTDFDPLNRKRYLAMVSQGGS